MGSDDRAVYRWLMASAAAVFLAVVIGGLTRLTESGLSITVWQPVRGVIPPLTADDWQAAYEAFRQIPQAATVHREISLEDFKAIFWWEWTHRMLARMVGLVLAVPYVWLLLKRKIRHGLRLRLALLPILAGAQGALGWYMVSSGLSERTSVSPTRLALHLAIAAVLWVLCFWTMLQLGTRSPVAPAPPAARRLIFLGWMLTAITLVSGALVAGLDAGMVYNTFPMMGDRPWPQGYLRIMQDWRAILEHPVIAQFHHRLLAVTTFAVLLVGAAMTRRVASVQRATTVAAILAMFQVSLGITTLLLRVPIAIAVLHQATGLALLAVTTWAVVRGRGFHAAEER